MQEITEVDVTTSDDESIIISLKTVNQHDKKKMVIEGLLHQNTQDHNIPSHNGVKDCLI